MKIPHIILIKGKPSTNKNEFAYKIKEKLMSLNINTKHFSGIDVRNEFSDSDYSVYGINNHAERMKEIATISNCDVCIISMVCPLDSAIDIIDPDLIINLYTHKLSEYLNVERMIIENNKWEISYPSIEIHVDEDTHIDVNKKYKIIGKEESQWGILINRILSNYYNRYKHLIDLYGGGFSQNYITNVYWDIDNYKGKNNKLSLCIEFNQNLNLKKISEKKYNSKFYILSECNSYEYDLSTRINLNNEYFISKVVMSMELDYTLSNENKLVFSTILNQSDYSFNDDTLIFDKDGIISKEKLYIDTDKNLIISTFDSKCESYALPTIFYTTDEIPDNIKNKTRFITIDGEILEIDTEEKLNDYIEHSFNPENELPSDNKIIIDEHNKTFLGLCSMDFGMEKLYGVYDKLSSKDLWDDIFETPFEWDNKNKKICKCQYIFLDEKVLF